MRVGTATGISVITATFNVANDIPGLILSLREQSDPDFRWIVVDGGSTDGTLDILASVNDLNISLVSERDFGIYDAINKAVRLSLTPYYLVLGGDDVLSINAIRDFKTYLKFGVEIVAANIYAGKKTLTPGRGPAWLFGQREYVAGHAVGTLFAKNLHQQYGYYSPKFPIAADQLFIKRCCQGGARIVRADFVAGTFGLDGVSASDSIGMLCEFFRVQLLTEKNKKTQLLVFIIRLLKVFFRKTF